MAYCVNCGVQYNSLVSIGGQCYLDPTILERTIDEKLKLFTIHSGRINDIDFEYFGERTSLFFSKVVEVLGDHPFPINRIKELLAFSESKSYLQAIQLS